MWCSPATVAIVAEGYEDRLIAFAAEHNKPGSKVGFVAINVNTGKADALPAMKERAGEEEIRLHLPLRPFAEDRDWRTANFTPECFVLNKDRKVVYHGRVRRQEGTARRSTTSRHAVQVTLDGEAVAVTETPARRRLPNRLQQEGR